MLLHTHHNNEGVPCYVLHATPAETKALYDAIGHGLLGNPESESFSLTLGSVEELDREEQPVITVEGLGELAGGVYDPETGVTNFVLPEGVEVSVEEDSLPLAGEDSNPDA